MEDISRLKNLKNRAVSHLDGFGAVHRLVEMRIEGLSDGLDADYTKPPEVIQQLFVNDLKALAVTFVFRFFVCGQRMLETVDHRDERLHNSRRGALVILGALLF